MQPEVPQQPLQGQLPQQAPLPAGAFQSSVPYPVAQVAQPIDPALTASPLKPRRSLKTLIVIVVLVVALLASLGFGGWAFLSRQDYKNNSDAISQAAVDKALASQKATLDAEFEEKQKSPFDTYSGKLEAGSVTFQYPRTWSAHMIEQTSGNPLNGYVHPQFVPNTVGEASIFALRVEVVNQQYADILKQYESMATQRTVTVAPYTFPKVPGSLGAIITGKIVQGKDRIEGTIVIMPIRDKTLKIWTESNSAFQKDFNDTVLTSLTFVP